MLVVYTTVLGNTKPLHEPTVRSDARFVCFTDQPIRSERWEIVQLPESTTPARECRRLKVLSHVVFPQAHTTLWTDSSFSLSVDPLELAEQCPESIATFRHPLRDRISDEAEVIIQYGKAKADAIRAQLAAYQADGFDTDTNPQRHISTGGFILRRHNEAVKRFNEFWHHEVQTRTLRDQMSIDYAMWKTGLSVRHLDGTHLDNPYALLTRYKRSPVDF